MADAAQTATRCLRADHCYLLTPLHAWHAPRSRMHYDVAVEMTFPTVRMAEHMKLHAQRMAGWQLQSSINCSDSHGLLQTSALI